MIGTALLFVAGYGLDAPFLYCVGVAALLFEGHACLHAGGDRG